MRTGKIERIAHWRTDFDTLERRSEELRNASESLRERSKLLLEPRNYYRQRLQDLQKRQRRLYEQMRDPNLAADVKEASGRSFAEGEEEIAMILQRMDEIEED